jgi:hypothetical protein
LKFAVQYNEEELQDQVVKFIGTRIREDLMDFKTFYSLEQDLFSALLESDEFPLDEISVFKLVNDWCEEQDKIGAREISTLEADETVEKVKFDIHNINHHSRYTMLKNS